MLCAFLLDMTENCGANDACMCKATAEPTARSIMVKGMCHKRAGDTLVKTIQDGVYEEKVKVTDSVFAYAIVEATPLDEATNVDLLRKTELHVLP
jgi:hypothetical protein